MDQSLMDKEVLCILDTRRIQRFLSCNNSFVDVMGASLIMANILDDAIHFALKDLSAEEYDFGDDPDAPIPYFDDPKIKVQQIICSAGNSLLIVRTGALAKQMIRKVSRYYLDHAYSLNVVAAAVEKTDNLGDDTFNLYKKLDKIKASSYTIEPQDALPVVMRENRTGFPAITKDEQLGDYISRTSELCRQKINRQEKISRIEELPATRHFDNRDYWAAVHLDGNNLGNTIGNVLRKSNGYVEGIRARRKINRNIIEIYKRLISRTMAELENFYVTHIGNAEDFSRAFHTVHQGGDDLNYISDASLIIPFLNIFYKNLQGEILWDTPALKIPLYICGGVAFVTKDFEFHTAYSFAEECAKSAKTTAKQTKNLKNGFAGNWIDFQIFPTPNTQKLPLLREKVYHAGGLRLDLRPYCFEDEDSARNFRTLLQRVKILQQLPPRQVNALRFLCGMGKQELYKWIELQKQRGLDLKATLGEPFHHDEFDYATWFDAAEIMDFVPAELEV